MIDRPKRGERVLLVQLALPQLSADLALAEFKELAESANAEVIATVLGTRSTPEAKYYVGLGKAEEIREQVALHNIDLVLVNHELSPSQERNLERLLQCRVIDRSGLILDIFAQRAQSFEGKLQVELAQLQHLSTRLVRGWTHLERQKGGIGLRGPGETQLETDRRLLRDRIKYINKRLEKVKLTRLQNRRSRQRSNLDLVSLVGYTNAGKSSLFNALSGGEAYVADKLFATLDPAMRKINLKAGDQALLIDTVGFVRDLPHQLIEAFRATLEETEQASLLLHVIDIADPQREETIDTVEAVLSELSVADIPLIQVFNKIDLVPGATARVKEIGTLTKVWVSAQTGEGLDLLRDTIATKLHGVSLVTDIHLSPEEAKLRAQLYQAQVVIKEVQTEEGGFVLTLKLTAAQRQTFFGYEQESDDE